LWKNCVHFSPISSARNKEMALGDAARDNDKNIKRALTVEGSRDGPLKIGYRAGRCSGNAVGLNMSHWSYQIPFYQRENSSPFYSGV
jgi:hypothetical protein